MTHKMNYAINNLPPGRSRTFFRTTTAAIPRRPAMSWGPASGLGAIVGGVALVIAEALAGGACFSI